jgi:O-antigen/teichoic acid export membrane protein
MEPPGTEVQAIMEPSDPQYRGQVQEQAARSVKWTTLANLLPRLVSPVSTMILAALLTPADFGTVAVSTLVIVLAQILVGLGLGPAVVQRRTFVHEAASAAQWLSLSASALLYGLLWIVAPWLAQVYDIPLVAPVVRVSGLSLFLFALGTVPAALLQRDMAFRKLFWVESTSQVANVLASVSLALLGLGVWALVLGPLVGAAARAALAWFSSHWRPSFAVHRAVLRPLLGFSLWTMGASFLSWLFLYADNAIAGYFLGETGLGIYSLGFSLSNLLPGLVIPPLSAVAYAAFCAIQNDRAGVGHSLVQLQTLAAAILFPLCFGLSAVAVPAIALLYGDKWQGLGEVIRLLALMPGLSHLWSLNADAYRAVGRPDVWTELAALALVVLLPLLLIAGQYGLMPFTLARAGGHLLYPLLNIFIGGRVLGLAARDQLRPLVTPLACTATMYLLVTMLVQGLTPFAGWLGWLKLLSLATLGAGIYLALLWLANRDLWHRLLLAGRQVFLRA